MACLYVVMVVVEGRGPWWLAAGGVLALSNCCLQAYTTHRQLRGKQSADTLLQKRLTSLLGWGVILLVFVPLFAPHAWAYLRQ
ncbi:MAG TPA: hypothetical protein VE913_01685 [Longimicrobium sp.]|nr:hypothetical protein [Longimicrobium sp.]